MGLEKVEDELEKVVDGLEEGCRWASKRLQMGLKKVVDGLGKG